jgi:hypothetical protein
MNINGKLVDIFWDNGKYVAVTDDGSGHCRRNYARYNCQTKIDAEIDIRNTFNIPLTKRQERHERGY